MPALLLLLAIVSFSILPSVTLLKEAKAQTGPTPTVEITSAVDGNGVPILTGGTTSSTSITIGFSVENPVGGTLNLICKLDSNPSTNCGGPTSRSITYNDLATGGHHFFLTAANDNGGSDNPATFSWTISVSQTNGRVTITSAVDGNGNNVPSDSTTVSSSITFTFSSPSPNTAFSCNLDRSNIKPCGMGGTGSITYTNLSPGQHSFLVSGTSPGVILTPSVPFFWAVGTGGTPPTLIQATQQLIQLKQSMHLAAATDRVLDLQLNIAIQFFQHNLKSVGCGHLNGFATEVQTFLQVGRLTQTQASQLLQGVQSVESTAGC